MKIDVEEDLIESNERNSMIVEDELNNFFDKEEGQNIKLDIELLNNMGYDKKMIKHIILLVNKILMKNNILIFKIKIITRFIYY